MPGQIYRKYMIALFLLFSLLDSTGQQKINATDIGKKNVQERL